MSKKFLIIRFSSIGDIIQCMTVVDGIKNHFPDSEIHWIARKDMSSFLEMDKRIDKIWGFDRKAGFKGLWLQAKKLKKENFDFVYDAHSNIRSIVLKTVLVPRWKRCLGIGSKFAMRSKERFKRILLFKFKIDTYPMPFKGMLSYRKPLAKWGITNFETKNTDWCFPDNLILKMRTIVESIEKSDSSKYITIVPSAAWQKKRWPVEYWKKLIQLLPNHNFMILAGPDDIFCKEIEEVDSNRVINLMGKTNLLESCYLVMKSELVISADTGFLHAADKFGIQALSLMGPTAFGFTTGNSIKTLEVDMKCRPCSKDGSGKCIDTVYQKCMIDITPEWVAKEVNYIMH